MLSVPREEAGGLSAFANYNDVSLGVGVSRREQQTDEGIGKVSYDVAGRRLRREHEMEAMRKRSTEEFYRSFYRLFNGKVPESSQNLPFDALQLSDLAATLAGVPLPDEIWSEDVNLQLHATTQIEKLHPTERECLVKNGVVRRLVNFLGDDRFPNLQVEAAWALIKIFYVTFGKTKEDSVCEAVPCFVRLLDSTGDDVCEQAVFALGIVASDSRKNRDFVLRSGVLVPLLKQLTKHVKLGNHANLSMLRNLTWTLSILCDVISDSSFEQVKPALTTLEPLLHHDDVEVLISSCWAFYGLSYKVHFRIDPLIDAGLCPKLVELLLHKSRRVQIPVLLTVALITFKQAHIQTLIDNGVLRPLWTLLNEDPKDQDPKDGDKLIKRQACRVLCGILDGNKRQIQDVIDANFFDHLVKLLESPHEGLQLKAAEAIATATARGSQKQIEYLVDVCKIISPICNLLSCPNPEKVAVVLQVLEKVLVAGAMLSSSGVWPPPDNPYIELILGTGYLDKIEQIWMMEIECEPDSYDSAPYVMNLLGLHPGFNKRTSKIDLKESESHAMCS